MVVTGQTCHFRSSQPSPNPYLFPSLCGSSDDTKTPQTKTDHTTHPQVNWNHLHGAMDRFSSFFTCPTFDNSSTEREMNAVNSEHQMNQQDDVSEQASCVCVLTSWVFMHYACSSFYHHKA